MSLFDWSVPGAGLRRLGKVLHLSKSGNVILRLESPEPPPIGVEVCNYKLERVGIVNNILGPVKAPYVSVQPFVDNAGTHAGRVLYQFEKE